MSLKKAIFLLVLSIHAEVVCAEPSVEVVKSCHEMTALAVGVKITHIEGTVTDRPAIDCDDQYQANIAGKLYGSAYCKYEQYFIIAGKFHKASLAVNKSIDSRMKPGSAFSIGSTEWYEISDKSGSYICMVKSVFENGGPADLVDFYIMRRLPETQLPEIYYYLLYKIDFPVK